MKTLRSIIIALITIIMLLVLPSCGECTHKDTEWNTITEATCFAEGVSNSVCKDCGAILEIEKLDKLPHTPGETTTVKEPTCIESGEAIAKCSVCSTEIGEPVSIDPTGHSFGRWFETIAPTTQKEGMKKRVCSVCSYEETESIPAHVHKAKPAVTENNVAATCTEAGGYDTVVYCSTCSGEISRVTTIIPSLGHKAKPAVEENRVESTCKSKGSYDEVVYCSACGEEIKRTAKALPLADHNLVSGVCSVCGITDPYSGFTFELLADGTYSVTGYTGTATEILIPSEYLGKKVTAIADRAFSRCTALTKIEIPDSVTSIGSSAFRNCSSLTSVVIGDSVTSIGDWAFEDCTKLKDVYYTGSVEDWCNISFSDGYSNPMWNGVNLYFGGELVTEIVIPDTVTKIKDYAFYYCTSLTRVVIPDGVTSIGDYAFLGCTNLKDVHYTGTKEQWNKIVFGTGNACLTGIVRGINPNVFGEGFAADNTSLLSLQGDPDVIEKYKVSFVRDAITNFVFGDGRTNFSGYSCDPEGDSAKRGNYYHGIKTVPDPENPENLVFLITSTGTPTLQFSSIKAGEFSVASQGEAESPVITLEFSLGKPNPDAKVTTGSFYFRTREANYKNDAWAYAGYSARGTEDHYIFRITEDVVHFQTAFAVRGADIVTLPADGSMVKIAITVFSSGVMKAYVADADGNMQCVAEDTVIENARYTQLKDGYNKAVAEGNADFAKALEPYANFGNWFAMNALEPTWITGPGQHGVIESRVYTDHAEFIKTGTVMIDGVETPLIGPGGTLADINKEAVKIYAEANFSFYLGEFNLCNGKTYGN